MEPLPEETIAAQRAEIIRLQTENLKALDQINMWSEQYKKLVASHNDAAAGYQKLLNERQDINKMQQVMTNLHLQRNKYKKGIILPGGNHII